MRAYIMDHARIYIYICAHDPFYTNNSNIYIIFHAYGILFTHLTEM